MEKLKWIFLPIFLVAFQFNGNAQINKALTAYSELRVFGKIQVRLEKSSVDSLVMESSEFDLDKVFIEVKDSILIIRLVYEFPAKIKVHATLFYTDLNTIVANAGSKIYNKGELDGSVLTVEAKSGCEFDLLIKNDSTSINVNKGAFVRLTGESRSVFLKTAVAGDYRATALATKRMVAKMHGGTAEVNVSDFIDANVSLGASLKYLSKPEKITQKTSFKGSIGILESY